MSKDGLPVKKPKKKDIDPAEIVSEKIQSEEAFDLDRVEKELRELDKQGGFLDTFFWGSPESRTLKKLKVKKEIEETRHELRAFIIEVEKQRITARTDLLALKAELLEKVIMSQEDVQKTLMEIKVAELNIEKLRIKLQELDIKEELKEREKELEHRKEGSSEGRYALKELDTLIEPLNDKEDDEEKGK